MPDRESREPELVDLTPETLGPSEHLPDIGSVEGVDKVLYYRSFLAVRPHDGNNIKTSSMLEQFFFLQPVQRSLRQILLFFLRDCFGGVPVLAGLASFDFDKQQYPRPGK